MCVPACAHATRVCVSALPNLAEFKKKQNKKNRIRIDSVDDDKKKHRCTLSQSGRQLRKKICVLIRANFFPLTSSVHMTTEH